MSGQFGRREVLQFSGAALAFASAGVGATAHGAEKDPAAEPLPIPDFEVFASQTSGTGA